MPALSFNSCFLFKKFIYIYLYMYMYMNMYMYMYVYLILFFECSKIHCLCFHLIAQDPITQQKLPLQLHSQDQYIHDWGSWRGGNLTGAGVDLFVCSSIHSFNKYLPDLFSLAGTVIRAGKLVRLALCSREVGATTSTGGKENI